MSQRHSMIAAVTALVLVAGLAAAGSLSAGPWLLPFQDEEQAPFVVDDRIEPPVRLSGPQPMYTEAARKEGIEGTVRLRAVIDEEGAVESVEALQELPYGLTESAMEAIAEWRFQPATLEGEAVSVYFELTVNFRLADKKKEDA